MANSSKFVLPINMASSSSNFLLLWHHKEVQIFNILDAPSCFTPLVHILSFIAIGIPTKRPTFSPFAIFHLFFSFFKASSVCSNKKHLFYLLFFNFFYIIINYFHTRNLFILYFFTSSFILYFSLVSPPTQ